MTPNTYYPINTDAKEIRLLPLLPGDCAGGMSSDNSKAVFLGLLAGRTPCRRLWY